MSLLAGGVSFDILQCKKDDHLKTSEYSLQGKYKGEVTKRMENDHTVCFCLVLLVSVYFCPFLSISVYLCLFQSVSVHLCPKYDLICLKNDWISPKYN